MNDEGRRKGVTLLGIAGVVLIAFKLSGLISWPWWNVVLPQCFAVGFLLGKMARRDD